MTVDSTLNEGPDQVAPADSYTSCDIKTPVKLRIQEEGDGSAVPISIPTLLRNTADRWPKRKALCVKRDGKWQSWTFQEYHQLVRTAAKSFIKLGLQPFQGVAIMGFNSPEYFIANMGAIIAGGVSTGMYTTSSEATCKFYLNNTHISVVVVENDKYLQKILNVRDQCPNLTTIVQYTGTPQAKGVLSWSEFLAEASSCDEGSLQKRLEGISVNQCASIIYTSGTTGDPKGVMVSHDIFTWVGAMGARKHSFHDGHDTMISYLPLSHGAAQIVEMYAALTAATTIYFAQPDALKGSLLNTLYEIQPTLFMGVPRIWEKMYEKLAPAFREGGPKIMLVNWCRAQATKHWKAKEKDPKTRAHPGMIAAECLLKKIRHKLGMSQVRSSVTTAAPISEDVVSFMHSLNIPVFEMYGLSETCGPSTTSGADGFRTGSIGHVFAECQIKIHEPDADGVGELLHRGRNTCMGYVNREADTAEAIDADGWMHTGDLARIDKDGYAYIEGRLKELLITAAGKNIAPVPIEGHIKSELPLLSNVMVVGDRKKFLSALFTVKVEMDVETGNPTDKLLPEASRWLSERGVQAETVTELLENISLISPHIQTGIDAANQKAECHASWVQKWRFLPKEFSIPGGELGPTLKLKRRTVLGLYQDLISDIYNS